MRRREFLRAGAACAAVIAAADRLPSAEAVSPGHRQGAEARMRLGLVTYNIASDWDLPTLIQRCRDTGYEGVELRTTHAHGVEPDITAERRREVRAMFQDSGVTLWGLGTACDYHRNDPAAVRENIELTKRFCELARDVGATGVKVRPNGLVEGVPEEKTLEQIGKALRECGQAAADNGVEIWLEVHGHETQHPPRIRRIMDVCGHPSVGVCWNSNPTDVKDGSIREYFELLRPFIRSCHITELANDYPWRELFALLRAAGYDRFTLQEIQPLEGTKDPEDIERFLRYYRALWAALQPGD